jgi:hypothetical protein
VKGEIATDIGREGVDGRVQSGESTSSRTVCVFRAAHDDDDGDGDVDGGYIKCVDIS